MLAEWAPALLVLAIPRDSARDVRIPMLPALALWLATYFVWHLPWIYDGALRRPHSLLHVEHLTYLVAGVALWWPVIRGAQNVRRESAAISSRRSCSRARSAWCSR